MTLLKGWLLRKPFGVDFICLTFQTFLKAELFKLWAIQNENFHLYIYYWTKFSHPSLLTSTLTPDRNNASSFDKQIQPNQCGREIWALWYYNTVLTCINRLKFLSMEFLLSLPTIETNYWQIWIFFLCHTNWVIYSRCQSNYGGIFWLSPSFLEKY